MPAKCCTAPSFILKGNKVKRLAPSFGGGARFIPEKYKQSIVKIYTFLYFKKNRLTPSFGWEAKFLPLEMSEKIPLSPYRFNLLKSGILSVKSLLIPSYES